jgi:hypothetical protein
MWERLIAFHDKLASLKFLDPACGCGNFLIINYCELRLLNLYEPFTIFPTLSKAYQKLDKAVKAAYRRTAGSTSFDDDSQRVAYLFELYQRMMGSYLPGRRMARGGEEGVIQ